jgi:hypothetical protein
VAATGGSAVLDYALTQGALLLDARPRGPGSGSALPVVTDPQTAAAARGGRLPLVLRDSPLDVRVVGTVPRFPTATGRFAVVDLDALARLTGRSTPLAGQPGELWVGAGSGGPAALARVLSAPPYDGLGVGLRAATQERLRTDPVARGAADLLAAGALVLLLVAGAALVLLVVADRSDDAGQVYAWEADGVPPSTLRASLWWRAVAVVAPAVPAGVAAGVLLSAVTARLVAVTATAGTPRPPLQGAAGAAWVAGAVGIGLALALAVTGLVAARSLREALPVRGRGVYR